MIKIKASYFFIICLLSSFIFAQNDRLKAGLILTQAKSAAIENGSKQISNFYIEASSRNHSRSDKVKAGYVPEFETDQTLWGTSDGSYKISKLFKYADGAQQRTDLFLTAAGVKQRLYYKSAERSNFNQLIFKEPGDPAENEKLLRSETRLDAFVLAFPVFFISDQSLVFDYDGVVQSKDVSAHILKVNIDNIYNLKLYIDSVTHRLLKIEALFTEPKTKNEIRREYFYSEYKPNNGFNFANKIVVRENGELIEERRIIKIAPDPTLPKNLFEQ